MRFPTAREPGPAAQDDFLNDLDPGTSGDDGSLDVQKYLDALRRRWPLIVVCCVIAGAYAMIRFALTTKEYQSTAVIQIERRQLATLAMGGQTSWLEEWWNMEYYPTQYRLLKSRGMAERVVENLRLMQDPSFTGRSSSLVPDTDADSNTVFDDQAELARLGSRLRSGLVVNPIRDTQLVELTYRATSPELAARIANGYAEAFIDWGIETRSATVSQASTLLERQVDRLREEISEMQIRLAGYGKGTEFALDPAGEALVEQQRSLQDKKSQVVARRLNKQATANEYRSMSDARIASTVAGTRTSVVQSEIDQLEAQYTAKLEDFRPEWPDMVALRESVDAKKGELRSMIRGIAAETRDKANAEYQQALSEERVIEAELGKLRDDMEKINSTALEFNTLELTLQSKQDLLNQLLTRQSDTEFASRIQDSKESNVRIVDRAVLPGAAFRPILKRDMTRALLLGFLIGAGLILLLEYLDRTIKTPEELEKVTKLPTLTVIPDIAQRDRGYGAGLRYGAKQYGYGYGYGYYGEGDKRSKRRRPMGKDDEEQHAIELLPHKKPRLAICESYRSLRTALLLSSAEELKTVAVTSAEPSEGKTSTTANLAVVMAQLGRNVLVIDCDLRRPRMHKVFDASNRMGVVNHLTGTESAESLIQPTSVPNLYLCPCGPIPPNPSELLASDRMRDFITTLRSRFDFVLIDTPPVLPVVDAAIIGQLVDGLVLCVRAGHLVREHAMACRERLRFNGIRLFGTVMNRYSPKSGSRYAKQYYYSEVYGDDETAAVTPRRDTAA